MSFVLPARRSRRPIHPLACTLAFLGACAAPVTHAVTDADLVAALDARGSLADLEQALELADLGPLAVPIPTRPDELKPDREAFWQAAAFAWNPELRQARRALAERRALAGSAGRPGPIAVGFENMEFGNADAEQMLAATVDLLGLLGLGPSAAARELADVETRAALARLESAVWRVHFQVERARAGLAESIARANVLENLFTHMSEDAPRIAILADSGWISTGMQQGAFGALHMVEHRLAMARGDVARRRADLARTCGVDFELAAFEDVQSGAIDRFRSEDIDWHDPDPARLLDTLPELRERKLELALAEAALRREASAQWPSLRLGPRLSVVGGDFRLGGMLGVDIPFPGALTGRIEAAHERREAAREALEDALVRARTRLGETRDALEQAVELYDEHAVEMDTAMARMLISAQARFGVDPGALDAWTLALRERTDSITTLVRARADVVLAWIDYLEARGVVEVPAEVQP